jgi:hypothetical protein
MNKTRFIKLFSILVIIMNAIYILWLLYNGMNEGFKNILSVQGIATLGMVVLLLLNIFLLVYKSS